MKTLCDILFILDKFFFSVFSLCVKVVFVVLSAVEGASCCVCR